MYLTIKNEMRVQKVNPFHAFPLHPYEKNLVILLLFFLPLIDYE